MKRVMLDLETMGTSSRACIVQIGACDVDNPGLMFRCNVSLQSCLDAGLVVDGSTVEWWLKQSEAARNSITEPAEPLAVALGKFTVWLGSPGPSQIWALPSTFDLVILGNAYRALGLKTPWQHRAESCLRTAGKLFPAANRPKASLAHDALSDALAQAAWLRNMVAA